MPHCTPVPGSPDLLSPPLPSQPASRPPSQVRFLQGRQHTWLCGSYTLFNTQEIAVMSGLAVAERLGAPYPFADDPLAAKQFDMFLGITHGAKRREAAAAGEKEAVVGAKEAAGKKGEVGAKGKGGAKKAGAAANGAAGGAKEGAGAGPGEGPKDRLLKKDE